MIKLLFIFFMSTSTPTVHMLEELATKSVSLSPLIELADLYFSAGMLDNLPVFHPIKGSRKVSSPYGIRSDPFTGKRKFHSGIDYACELAAAVHATASGIVTYVGYRGGYGRCVVLRHRYGFKTIYAHLSCSYVKSGDIVSSGKVLGFVGSTGRSTGCHLHYEVRKNNKVVEPLFVD